MRSQPKSCYFADDEQERIARIAEQEERSESQIVQFAVRVFSQLYEKDPLKTLAMAQRKPLPGLEVRFT